PGKAILLAWSKAVEAASAKLKRDSAASASWDTDAGTLADAPTPAPDSGCGESFSQDRTQKTRMPVRDGPYQYDA
ncbi:MAG TPA: hypothetical protein VLY63_22825, partial [Anaerolineae bacterium]|nr:hypothetical protein [Anaerolineae bacterium]